MSVAPTGIAQVSAVDDEFGELQHSCLVEPVRGRQADQIFEGSLSAVSTLHVAINAFFESSHRDL